MEAGPGVIERKRIESSDLDSTNACGLHLFQFLLQLGLRDCGTKPPPAHHDSTVVRRVRKCLFQRGQVIFLLGATGQLCDTGEESKEECLAVETTFRHKGCR